MIGLGCMRLSTLRERNDERAVEVVRAALDAGITLLDTSDAYCVDDADRGHNERLIARAIAEWGGDRTAITVATKGGMRRPRGEWVPDGKAKSIREACDASRRALGQDRIDLYQLHVVDPKTPLATSVRALARLRDDGWIRDVGLCNVTVSQIREAQEIVPISTVQVSLGAFDDENLRNGVAEYCRDCGIRLIAYRPLGGERRKSLARDIILRAIADRNNATPEEVVLAWLMTFGAQVTPLPGATRLESIASIARATSVRLSAEDRDALDRSFAGTLLRVPRAERRPKRSAEGDVVIVMGMPGAGKTTVAREFESLGYVRINRDETGGSLADLVESLDESLDSGQRKVVLDNTYPSRASRNGVIESAWRHGVLARCIWLTTDIARAQVNSIRRMLDAHGSLPTPEEIKQRSRRDTRYLLPDAQFRYERALERPTTDEGFEVVDEHPYVERSERRHNRAIVLDLDALGGEPGASQREVVGRYHANGWHVFVHAWRPQVARGEMSAAEVEREFAQLQKALGVDVDWAYCPHDAGPPACWCRKPIPGPIIAFAMRRDVALDRSIVVGSSAADRTMAERVGAKIVGELPG